MAGLGLNGLVYHACGHSFVEDGIEVFEPVPDEQCYRFGPRMRMRGLWLYQFEGSEFLQNYVEPPDISTFYRNDVWLNWSRIYVPCLSPRRQQKPVIFAIDFIGRKSAYPGHYGHLGRSRNLILAEKVLSIRRLDSPTVCEKAVLR
jgi:hypothetical protein